VQAEVHDLPPLGGIPKRVHNVDEIKLLADDPDVLFSPLPPGFPGKEHLFSGETLKEPNQVPPVLRSWSERGRTLEDDHLRLQGHRLFKGEASTRCHLFGVLEEPQVFGTKTRRKPGAPVRGGGSRMGDALESLHGEHERRRSFLSKADKTFWGNEVVKGFLDFHHIEVLEELSPLPWETADTNANHGQSRIADATLRSPRRSEGRFRIFPSR